MPRNVRSQLLVALVVALGWVSLGCGAEPGGSAALEPDRVEETVTTSDRDILLDLNRDYIRSVQNPDVGRFEEILAEDFRASNPDGSIVDKAGFLRQTAQPVTISNLEANDVEIRIMGDVAIIHAATSYVGPLHGCLGPSEWPVARRVGPRHPRVRSGDTLFDLRRHHLHTPNCVR